MLEVIDSPGVGEQAVVTDAVEAFGENVDGQGTISAIGGGG